MFYKLSMTSSKRPPAVLPSQLGKSIFELTKYSQYRDAAGFSNPGGLAIMWWA